MYYINLILNFYGMKEFIIPNEYWLYIDEMIGLFN